MIIRKVDSSNDWQFGKGLSSYAKDEEAVAQNIRSRVLLWKWECFFALPEGVDWRNRLEVGQGNNLVQEIKGVILQSYGVTGVNSITVDDNHETRIIGINYDLETIFSRSFLATIEDILGVSNV